jgi:hypothetical protein
VGGTFDPPTFPFCVAAYSGRIRRVFAAGCEEAVERFVAEVNVAFYPLQDLTNVTVDHRNRSKPTFII